MFLKLTFWPAWLILTADDDRLVAKPAERFTGAWRGLILLSLVWGLTSIGLWNLAGWLFGWPGGMYVMQALTVAAIMLLIPYRRATEALVNAIAGPEATARSIVSAVVVIGLVTCLTVLRPDWYRQEQILPNWLVWIRPESKIDRVLLLMPLWGSWAMLILPHFRRLDRQISPAVAAMARGCGPMKTAVFMGMLLATTIGYFAYLPWIQLTISAAGVAGAIGGGLFLAYRNGRMDRNVLLATNVLTQLSVLATFLANRDLQLW